MTNTKRERLPWTALPAEQISEAMEACRSGQKVLVLDCCYSGAFPAGWAAKADSAVHTLEKFGGKGRAVLTASDATQYSFEGDDLIGEGSRSVFTRCLVEGLRTGKADLDSDGDISLDDLYRYVHDRVVEEMPEQRPKKQENIEGRIVVARNVHWQLPGYLRNAIGSPISTDRRGALDELHRLHRIGNDLVRAAVLDQVRALTGDDSRAVSSAATSLLTELLPEQARLAGHRDHDNPVDTVLGNEVVEQPTDVTKAEPAYRNGPAEREQAQPSSRPDERTQPQEHLPSRETDRRVAEQQIMKAESERSVIGEEVGPSIGDTISPQHPRGPVHPGNRTATDRPIGRGLGADMRPFLTPLLVGLIVGFTVSLVFMSTGLGFKDFIVLGFLLGSLTAFFYAAARELWRQSRN